MKTSVNLEVHPAALLFPLMGEEELGKLADDIAANGLMEPVVLYHGQILDGRNRLAACELGGVQPRFVEVDGELPSPTIYVLSKNLHRRHLTTTQRAVIAAEVVPMLQEESAKIKLANLKNQQVASKAPTDATERSWSTGIAADAMQVGRRTVERVLEVKRKDPELYEKVKREEISPSAAENMLPREHKSTRSDVPYEPKTDRQKKLAEGQKERMVKALSVVTGICRGLESADIRKIVAACDDEERNTWVERAKELASQLRAFSARLQKGF